MILDLLNDSYCSISSNTYKFRTNAKSFKINYIISHPVEGNYPHFGISAREGLMVLYRFVGEDIWFNLDAFARYPNIVADMTYIADGEKLFDVLIYGPNLTALDELKVEIPDGHYGEIMEVSSQKKLMVLGGLNSFGIGCTTSGALFSNILQRTHDAEIKRVVFNESNFLDKIYDYLIDNTEIPHVDVSILEVDYINQNDVYVDRYLLDIINILKEYSNHVICWLTIPNNKEYKRQKVKDLLAHENVIFEDLSCIHDEFYDMCTYSRYFINDSANIFIFKRLNKKLNEVANWNI